MKVLVEVIGSTYPHSGVPLCRWLRHDRAGLRPAGLRLRPTGL